VDDFGRFDCIFNNAGSPGVGGPIESTPVEGFDATVAVLLRGVFLGMKHAAPILKAQGHGTIISTGSVAGLGTGYAGHIYSAAKAAVIHLTRSVAMELRESGVRVNCICPGFIATPIFARAFGLPLEADDQVVAILESETMGLGQPGRPEDIARAALWLASDESSFVNGHALVVDNGLTGGYSWQQFQSWVGQAGSALASGE
jgi:NAD(P)-dependent dehydrogenase (short-subunit alcohol dehydrogenase family)